MLAENPARRQLNERTWQLILYFHEPDQDPTETSLSTIYLRRPKTTSGWAYAAQPLVSLPKRHFWCVNTPKVSFED
jgi:hypothetical protein